MNRNTLTRGAVVAVALAVVIGVSTTTSADQPIKTGDLRDAVTAEGVLAHLEALQEIADNNDGNRAAGTSGHEASAGYVQTALEGAGYETWTQPFEYTTIEVSNPVLAQTAPGQVTYIYDTDYSDMSYTGGGGPADAPVTAVDVNLVGDRLSTSGCESADFAGFPAGNIALIQRGTCPFRDKAVNAFAAEASAVIIFNQGNVNPDDDRFGLFFGTLDPDSGVTVPVLSTTFALGETLANLATGGLRMSVNLDVAENLVETFNLFADSPTGRTDRTVVVGAHLDSVPEGPGINDNGSGTAANLEVALQLAELGQPLVNRVRFAFWGGEEDGLIGSTYYVSQLSPREIKNHAVNLNFDMVGSPNYVNFVYDGDGSAFGLKGPNGSALVESVFNDFFASQGADTVPTEFDGRSDYFGFINAGIPAGGLFTGAEGLKTIDEAASSVGGTAGAPYDPCYHQACDTIDNLNMEALDIMSDAIAHSTMTFAMTSAAVNGTSKGKAGQNKIEMTMKGNRHFK